MDNAQFWLDRWLVGKRLIDVATSRVSLEDQSRVVASYIKEVRE